MTSTMGRMRLPAPVDRLLTARREAAARRAMAGIGDPGEVVPVTARRPPVVRRRPGFAGIAGAVVLFALAQTPSLLPRSWFLQGIVAGFTAAIGYGVGATAGAVVRWTVRRLRHLDPRPGTRAWLLLGLASAAVVAAALTQGLAWQREVHRLVGIDGPATWHPVRLSLLATGVLAVCLLLARVVRLAARSLGRGLSRFVPVQAANAVATLVVGIMLTGFVQGFLFEGFVDGIGRMWSLRDDTIPPGLTPPTSPTISGGPGSLVDWSTLGYKGREFTGIVTETADLRAFSGREPTPPIRVYVGLRSAESARDRIALAMAELDRTGAWDRDALAVVTTTGTGWVDPRLAASLEYLWGGNSAIVAMQYSYLPSWISFLNEKDEGARDGTMLIDAVRERWAALPKDHRPKLLLAGESLGSLGIESTFADLDDLASSVDGALLVGPTSANPVWNDATRTRDPGSPVWRPVVDDGTTVQFLEAPGDLDRVGAAPAAPRVVYLQNSSDPVVWWSSDLLWRRPAWLEGTRGPDVSSSMRWYPVVTFWQVAVDLVFAIQVPPGHGHCYGAEMVDGWAALATPPGWSATDTARLRVVIDDPDLPHHREQPYEKLFRPSGE